MHDAVAVLNAGSSSLKFSVFTAGEDPELRLSGQAEGLYTAPHFVAKDAAGRVVDEHDWGSGQSLGHEGALDYLLSFFQARAEEHPYRVRAVGHRVVHGGLEYTRPVRVTAGVVENLERLVPLAPLHQPHNLAPIRLLLARAPELVQVACFDTAFHCTQPELACLFGLPAELTRSGVRRYGFHGLSYEFIASTLPAHDAAAARGRTVVLHLGNGASMCALHNGRSVASTMGFTAVDGLPMGTRCGALDPGVILYLMDEHGMSPREIETLIYQRSGLLGISGISSDMRVLLASSEPGAKLAVDYFVYRIGRELGSLAAALGGLDAVVFTAGIGENAAAIRARVCRAAGWLGVRLDPRRNAGGGPRISEPGSQVSVWVIPTNEELMIARHTLHAVAGAEVF
jgi:acetate kinase